MSLRYSILDQMINQFDYALKTLSGHYAITERDNPADTCVETELSDQETKVSGALMRVNHAGEIAAQGLYQGQALTARLPQVRAQMERAAREENDHLYWCADRCQQLQTHTSYLSPFWYLGSFTIGALAGAAGDKWSLGFVAETEHQVVKHLQEHLRRLPKKDQKSRAIIQQMQIDEGNHAKLAENAGARTLPVPIKIAMQLTSKIMTGTAYYV